MLTADFLTGFAARLVRRYGDRVLPWVRDAPALATRIAAEWDLVLGTPFTDGQNSLTVRCTAAGRLAVLKLCPDHAVIVEQARVLRAFGPSGRVPDVLRADPDRGVLLLAQVRPGTQVIAPTAAEFGPLLTDLHRAVPDPEAVTDRDLRSLMTQFYDAYQRRLDEPGVAGVVTPADFEQARAIGHRLLDSVPETVLLHGDLHYGNLLHGGAGLVAIDPKATRGEACFDAVDFVLDGTEPVTRRLTDLLAATDLPADRLADWCRAVAPMDAISLISKGIDASDVLHFGRRG